MDTGFNISRRLLLATIFGTVLMGSALYYTSRKPASVLVVPNKDSTKIIEDATSNTKTQQNILEATKLTNNIDDTNSPVISPTQTDILTGAVIGSYFKQAEQGTYSPEVGQRIVETATEQMFTLNFTPLEPRDILTSSDQSKEGALTYKNSLQSAVQPLFNLKEYELTVYARAMRDNSKADFDSLQKTSEIYKKAGDEALKVASPRDVSAVHLAIINSLYKFAIVLESLSKGYDDPVASLAGSGQFNAAEEEIGQAFNQLQTYFILKEIDTK